MNAWTLRYPVTTTELAADVARQTVEALEVVVQDMGLHAAAHVGLVSSGKHVQTVTVHRGADQILGASDEETAAYFPEVDSVRLRVVRLKRIVACLRGWERSQQRVPRDTPQSTSSSPAAHTTASVPDGGRACSNAVRHAIAALAGRVQQLGVTGITQRSLPPDVFMVSSPARVLQPAGLPVSFSEACLNLYSHNLRIVFRRPKATARGSATPSKGLTGSTQAAAAARESGAMKRERSLDVAECGDAAALEPHRCSVQQLQAEQKKLRWQLYTCRDALLPTVDRLASSDAVRGPPLSPALRLYNKLNKAAEATMLCGAWRAATKAQLLQELPRLHEDVAVMLHTALSKALPCASTAALEPTVPSSQPLFTPPTYFRVAACDAGVVRLIVQEALHADLTYDMTERIWTVCRLHWNVWTTTAGATLMNTGATGGPAASAVMQSGETAKDDDVSEEALATVARMTCDENSFAEPRLTIPADRTLFLDALLSASARCEVKSDGGPAERHDAEASLPTRNALSSNLRAVLLGHTDAMQLFVQKRFREQGFAAGCFALNQLVCAVVMDMLIRQLQTLRRDFFVGPLQSSFSLDVRAGTFVAAHLLVPPVITAPTTLSPQPPLQPLHMRFDVIGGTVVVDRVWGTDSEHRRRTLLLHPSRAGGVDDTRLDRPIVVNAEALLWGSYS